MNTEDKVIISAKALGRHFAVQLVYLLYGDLIASSDNIDIKSFNMDSDFFKDYEVAFKQHDSQE